MGVIKLPGAVADPEHMAAGAVPVAGGGIDARKRLLVAKQQRLVAGEEIGGAHLRMNFRIDAAGAHEIQRLGEVIGELLIAFRLRTVVDERQHPLVRVRQVGVAAGGEGAQKIERRRRLPISFELPARIGNARLRREVGAVDDVATIRRQLDAAAFFGRRRARLGELAGNAADLHHRRRRRIGQHHRHLQKQPEKIADIVGAVLGEALGAIATLEEECLAGGNLRQSAFEIACLACKNQRRKARKLRFDVGQRLDVGIIRHLHDRPMRQLSGLHLTEFVRVDIATVSMVRRTYTQPRPVATGPKTAYSAASRA